MKKLIKILSICFVVCLLFTGCSSSKKTTHLKMTNQSDGIEIVIDIELVHDNKKVSQQNQKSVITADDEVSYQYMVNYMNEANLSAESQKYEGSEYELTNDDEKFMITEIVNLDFSKLSAEGYKVMTMGSVTPDEKYYVDYEKTIDNLTSQGFEVID